MNIYLDMDGVTFDFNRQMRQYLGVTDEPTTFEYWKQFAGFKRCMFIEDFWSTMHIYPHTEALMSLCRKYGNVYFCSTPYASSPNCWSGKQKAIESNFGINASKKLILVHDKSLLDRRDSFLIDDKDENVESFNRSFLWPQKYNRNRRLIEPLKVLERKLNEFV